MKRRYYICPHCEKEAHHINWLTPSVLVCEHCHVKTALHEYEQVYQTRASYFSWSLSLSGYIGGRLYEKWIFDPWIQPIYQQQSTFWGFLLWYLLMLVFCVVCCLPFFGMASLLLRPFEIRSLTKKFNKLYQAGKLEERDE